MQLANERRGQPRAALDTTVIAFIGDERIECRAVDISANGIALLSPVVRSNGQFLRVNFSLPVGGASRWLDADGVVARVVRAEQGILLGVQFLVIEDRAARDVHAYVEHTREATARARQQEVYLRRVATGAAATSAPAAAPVRDAVISDHERMPDAAHPPQVTGEFVPATRRTDEYARSVDDDANAVGTAATLESPRVAEAQREHGAHEGESSRPVTGESSRPVTGESSRPVTGESSRPVTGESSRAATGERSRTTTSERVRAAAIERPREAPGAPRRPTGETRRPTGETAAPPGRFPGEAADGAGSSRHGTGEGEPRRATRPMGSGTDGGASSPRRPTPTVASRPAGTQGHAPNSQGTPGAASPKMSRNDLAALYRDALDEVEGKPKGKKRK